MFVRQYLKNNKLSLPLHYIPTVTNALSYWFFSHRLFSPVSERLNMTWGTLSACLVYDSPNLSYVCLSDVRPIICLSYVRTITPIDSTIIRMRIWKEVRPVISDCLECNPSHACLPYGQSCTCLFEVRSRTQFVFWFMFQDATCLRGCMTHNVKIYTRTHPTYVSSDIKATSNLHISNPHILLFFTKLHITTLCNGCDSINIFTWNKNS